MDISYEFGNVPVAEASRGQWRLEPFEVSQSEANFHNMRCALRRGRIHMIVPGRYMRLRNAARGVVMSNTPMEVLTNREAYRNAHGKVLVNGLGLGMLLDGLLRKAEVQSVRVIEIDRDVIDLVAPRFAQHQKFEVVHADAFAYRPGKGEVFDYVWHDIWDDFSRENIPQMKKLVARYRKPRASAQGVWSRGWL